MDFDTYKDTLIVTNASMLAGSTATDCLCLECAKERGLCKWCGGDIDGKVRRKVDLEFKERDNG